MRNRIKPPLPSEAHRASVDLRADSTDVETKLWYYLRAGRLNGLKFRRQHPFPPYVVDFYCHEARLVVELDGSQHDQQADAVRQQWLEAKGLKVLRFWNSDALQNPNATLEAILIAARDRTLCSPMTPQPEAVLRSPIR